MSDGINKPTGKNSTPSRPRDEGHVLLRVISTEELQHIVGEHEKWLRSDGKEGHPADLEMTDLAGCDLQGAALSRANFHQTDLRRANLSGADLQGAHLVEANLKQANLSQASIQEADLKGADLRGADLRGANLLHAHLALATLRDARLNEADLSDTRGTLEEQLGGVDASFAKLPEEIAKFGRLRHTEEISKNARLIFFSMVAACVYSWLTISTTRDAALLTNTTASPLPVIQTHVPIAGFYWAAPPILLGLFIYLHLYLQSLWEELASLPAIFPDGRTLDQHAYPWLLTSVVNAYVPLLRKRLQNQDHPPFVRLRIAVSVIATWCLVPITLFLFWVRYLPLHDWPWTMWQASLLFIAIALGIEFFLETQVALRHQRRKYPHGISHDVAIRWRNILGVLRSHRFYTWLASAIVLVPLLSLGVIFTPRLGNDLASRNDLILFRMLDQPRFLDLEGAAVSSKPDNWTGLGSKNELKTQIARVKEVDLREKDLRYAHAPGAFFVKSDLRKADLRGANFGRADLREANLSGAQLNGAHLYLAQLQRANLFTAQLQGADIGKADLEGANLWGANLSDAILVRANLRGANLATAKLTGAQLDWADLRSVDFEDADLKDVTFWCADLSDATLSEVDNLVQEQLTGACGNHDTKLPRDLSMEICPLAKTAIMQVGISRASVCKSGDAIK